MITKQLLHKSFSHWHQSSGCPCGARENPTVRPGDHMTISQLGRTNLFTIWTNSSSSFNGALFVLFQVISDKTEWKTTAAEILERLLNLIYVGTVVESSNRAITIFLRTGPTKEPAGWLMRDGKSSKFCCMVSKEGMHHSNLPCLLVSHSYHCVTVTSLVYWLDIHTILSQLLPLFIG